MDKSELEKLEWKKNWSGKWTLLECCYFGREYTWLLSDSYGAGPKHSLFLFEDGHSSNYLVPQEVGALTEVLIKKVEADNALATQWANDIMTRADDVLRFAREHVAAIEKRDFDMFWDLLDAYLKVHFPIKKIVDYLPKELLEELLPTLEKARVYAEPVYAESLEFVKRFGDAHASKYGLEGAEFLAMTKSELESVFADGPIPTKETLRERLRFSMLVVFEGEVVDVVSGADAHALAEATVHRVQDTKQIKGSIAFPGKVTGKVVIVTNPEGLSSLPSGSVLVTGMTRPNYIHLFKEAVAVVTDAGGVLSHAAITARELKIPTVIGTEVATKVLKDGDLIEVDADKGVVRIIAST